MGNACHAQGIFFALWSLDQNFGTGFKSKVGNGGAFEQHFPFFGRPVSTLLPNLKQMLIVIIWDCIKR